MRLNRGVEVTRENPKRFEYFDHPADVGIIGFGGSLEEAFEEGAKAMFQVMAEIDRVEPMAPKEVEVDASDEESLLIRWLNALLALKDLEHMFFSDFKVKIRHLHDALVLKGVALGETIDIQKHYPKVEVKAATYSQLRVERSESMFRVQCVVDV